MQLTRLLDLSRARFRIMTFGLALLALAPLLQAEVKQSPPNTLTRIRQTATLKLGYYTDARPLSYQDEAGRPAGYAIAICQQIANDLKNELKIAVNLDFIAVTTADRFDALRQGKIDLLCGPSVPTLARRKDVSYSIPVFPAGLAALLRADAPAQVRETLSGREAPYRPLWRGSIGLALQKRSFSAVTGTTSLDWLNSKIDQFKIDAKVVPVDSHDDGVQKVLDRSTDVLFGERSILLDAKKRSPSAGDLIVLDRLFTYEPLALALPRDDEDFRLFVDQSISRLGRSGAIQSLYRSFFGEPDENTLTFFRLSNVPE